MSLLTTITAALAGAALFELLRVPAGALIGAMVAVTILNLAPSAAASELPTLARFLAFAAVGWLIGQGITGDVLRSLVGNIRLIGITVVLLLVFGGLLALALVRLGLLDPATAFLATSPGGLAQMSALSAAVDADASVVATLHILRVVSVIAIAPLVLRFLPGTG